MKPNNPLENVVFIKAEIKTESDDEECDTSKRLISKESDNKVHGSKHVIKEKPKKMNKKNYKDKLNKVENVNSLYEVFDTDIIEDAHGQWTCNKCGLKYVNRTRLVYHMRRLHNVVTNFKFKCQHCGLEYGRLEGLKKHIKRKHEAPKFTVSLKPNVEYNCKYCGSVYGFKQSLYRHMKIKHLQTDPTQVLQTCTFCPATFTQSHNLLHHIKRMHDVDEVFCDQCGMKFLGKNALILHIESEHNKNDLKLNTNEHLNYDEMLKIYNQGSIKWYKNTFLSNGRKQCKFCDQILSNTNRIKYHIRTKHSDEYAKLKKEMDDIESLDKKFDCIICGQKYKNSVTLRFHIKLKHNTIKVTNDKSFTCEYCGLLFTSHTSLVYHLKKKHLGTESEEMKGKYDLVHVEVEKEISEKISKQTDDGNVHEELVKVKKTTVEKRYQCDLCGHTCKNIQSIKHHKIAKHTKTNEHVIKCPHCDYVTKFKQYLQKHILVKHSDLKETKNHPTFVCEVCGYNTQFKYRLNRHLNTHHTDKKFL